MNAVAPWIEALVAILLVCSGVFVVIAATGFLRLPGFFLRMHPPALTYTIGSWCVALAGVLYFSALEGRLALHPLLVPVFLAITVPVTTVLLARVALFRRRLAGKADTPPSLASADASPPEEERSPP
ncbi:Na+/H+ antiporter subunit G [Lysobacter auxotrophicus]|uniref:Na+/H+ antiporter subunit G n=1 Tax=Lysobacter auxotrophicus TaxID=2992573 RepID=A0ABN6UJT1_9GAMM|nr:Na+/H+ antiporter subunit G [Lysobacter auxotrophicus]BDU16486.1 Na+/H+ antiporter subunit G [Lysobacter auxotrophicus]